MKISKKIISIFLCIIIMLGNIAVGGEGFADMLKMFSVKANAESDIYNVSFNANGGSGNMLDAISEGNTFILPANEFTAPSDDKYFAGWALSENGQPILDETIVLISNTILYAIWADAEMNVDKTQTEYDHSDDIHYTIYKTSETKIGDPDGIYIQPYISSANPDDIAEAYFKTYTNNKVYTQKTRNIVIDIIGEGSQEDGTFKIFVNVTFHYEFIYLVQNTNEAGIGVGTYRPATFEKDIAYSAIPSGASLHSDGSPVSCYVMYYPQYGTASRPATDIITINNLNDIPVKLVLIKQWPMVYNAETDVYSEMDSVTLDAKEKNYKCEIREKHSASYNLEMNDETDVYTNARINLTTYGEASEEISSVTYSVGSENRFVIKTYLIRNSGFFIRTSSNEFSIFLDGLNKLNPDEAKYLSSGYKVCEKENATWEIKDIVTGDYELAVKGKDEEIERAETLVSTEDKSVYESSLCAGDESAPKYSIVKKIKHYDVVEKYNTHDSYLRTVNIIVSRINKYAIIYNANGGIGAPEAQTKVEGEAVTLSSSKPTRDGYEFLGWAETSSAKAADYSASGSFTKDSDVTLYAVWKHPIEDVVINVVSEKSIDYRSFVTITATAENVPNGYHLAMLVDKKGLVFGSNTEVSFELGELMNDVTYSVFLVDSNNNIQKDINGNNLMKEGGKITCKAGFIQKLVAFFKGLFGSLPKVEVKP